MLIPAGLPGSDLRAANRPSPPAGPAELYFLAVGSEVYLATDPKVAADAGVLPMRPVTAPAHAARRVADALMEAGARYGIVLTSKAAKEGSEPEAVSRADVQGALEALKKRIREDGATAPRIVFYFMGHGSGDEPGRHLYLIPGDLGAPERPTQSTTMKLIENTVWDQDILSALVNFRVHPSMRHFDDFFPSQVMPDPSDPSSLARSAARQQELAAVDAERRKANAYPREGNPPVPFVALFDNCYGGIESDLLGDAPWFSALMDELRGKLVNEAAVLYAAKPGLAVGDLEDPDGDGDIGPLALQLIEALKRRDQARPLSFEALRQALLTPSRAVTKVDRFADWQPWTPPTEILPDIKPVDFIPAAPGEASAEPASWPATGTTLKSCCT